MSSSSRKNSPNSRSGDVGYSRDIRVVDIPLIMIKGTYEMAKQILAGCIFGATLAITGPVIAESGLTDSKTEPVVVEVEEEVTWRDKVASVVSSGVEATKDRWESTKEKGATLFNLDEKIKARDAEILRINSELAACRSTQRTLRIDNELLHNEIITETQAVLDYLYDVRAANAVHKEEK